MLSRLAMVVLLGAGVVGVASPASADATTTRLGPAASSAGNRTFEAITIRVGLVAYQWWDGGDPNAFSHIGIADGPAAPNAMLTDASPAVSLVGNGSYVFLLAKRTDGLLMINQGGLNSAPNSPGASLVGWQSMGITTSAAPAAAAAGNRTAAVITEPDGRILYDWWDLGGGGHGFREVPGGGRTNAAPAVTLVANGTYMFVVVKGLDNQLWLNQGTPGGAFVGWQPMGIATNVAPAAVASGNRSAIVVTTPAGGIAYDWWDLGGGTHGLLPVPGMSGVTVSPGAGFIANGTKLLALATGPDLYVYQSQVEPGGATQPWTFNL